MGGSSAGRVKGILKSHPVVMFMLLTPGIPEYLSSSSPINAVILNPPMFLFQLLANTALYLPGALLVREAKVRWTKGWGTVLLLGAAYGILEEGVALSTLFDPKASPVGSLGSYGHWLGVYWVWAAGIVPFHAVFSISLPILLLGLALPETSGRPLLGGRKTAATLVVLSADVILLMLVVNRASGYWMGWPILVSSLLTIAALIWAGFRAPGPALVLGSGGRTVSKKILFAIGVSFLLAIFLTEGLAQAAHLPPAVGFLLVLLVEALYPVYLSRRAWRDPPRGTVVLAAGLLTPIMTIGVAAELALPLTIAADLAAFAFFVFLWKKYPSTDSGRTAAPGLDTLFPYPKSPYWPGSTYADSRGVRTTIRNTGRGFLVESFAS